MQERASESMIMAAEEVLFECFDQKIQLLPAETLRTSPGNTAIRCEAVDMSNDLPSSFIVKSATGEQAILGEWAAVQFLNTIPNDPPFAPHLYGGDKESGVIVLEDLGRGDGPNPYDLLARDNATLAAEGLLEISRLYGLLHASTIGKLEQYHRFLDDLLTVPPAGIFKSPWAPFQRRTPCAHEITAAAERYEGRFEMLGLSPTVGFQDEIESVVREVEEDPAPFLGFCQGDQNMPNNCVRSGSHLRLFDFESSGFRHVLIEGMPGRLTYGCTMRIPEPVVAQMTNVYRAELSQKCAEARDDKLFHKAMVDAGARWHIFHVLNRLPHALEKDYVRGSDDFPTTLRQQLIAWLEAFADLSDEFGYMEALGKSARDVAIYLRSSWPELPELPSYPAFQGR